MKKGAIQSWQALFQRVVETNEDKSKRGRVNTEEMKCSTPKANGPA